MPIKRLPEPEIGHSWIDTQSRRAPRHSFLARRLVPGARLRPSRRPHSGHTLRRRGWSLCRWGSESGQCGKRVGDGNKSLRHLRLFPADDLNLCLQETKARPEQVDLPLDLAGYQTYWYSAEKPGYSSTAIFSKKEPFFERFVEPTINKNFLISG